MLIWSTVRWDFCCPDLLRIVIVIVASSYIRVCCSQLSTIHFCGSPKQNCIVVISSNEEQVTLETHSSSSTHTKPNPKSSATGSRGSKKARVSNFVPCLSKLREINLFDGDFSEVFTRLKVFTGMLFRCFLL
ncbi:unnamed protein product [Lathyrus sativus]|nr:unnamed protein product [Lathyrus sativus]